MAAIARDKDGSVPVKSQKVSESGPPHFSPVKTGLGGVRMVTTIVDFFDAEFDGCKDECCRLVDSSELTVSKDSFLRFFIKYRSGELTKSLLRATDLKYDGESLNPQDFAFSHFRRNLDRMNIILAAKSELDLCPGDIVKLYEYKTLLSAGKKLTRNVTSRFPKQLRAWFSRVLIFYMTFNVEEIGAPQSYPGPERRILGDTDSVAVKACQARHHYYPTKIDFLNQRGIADTEGNTRTFAKKGPGEIPLESSPCIPVRDWRGSVLREQTLVENSQGDLVWRNSSSNKRSYELAGVLRNLFWSYLCSPLLKQESDGLWDAILDDTATKEFLNTDTADSYRKQWKSLPDFFRKMLNPTFFRQNCWSFGPSLDESDVLVSKVDEILKVADDRRSLTFPKEAEPNIQSGDITRYVWPVTVWSQKPQNNFGFKGSFHFYYPLFSKWDYRF